MWIILALFNNIFCVCLYRKILDKLNSTCFMAFLSNKFYCNKFYWKNILPKLMNRSTLEKLCIMFFFFLLARLWNGNNNKQYIAAVSTHGLCKSPYSQVTISQIFIFKQLDETNWLASLIRICLNWSIAYSSTIVCQWSVVSGQCNELDSFYIQFNVLV